MTKPPDTFDDAEQAAYIDQAPAHMTFEQIAQGLAATFGTDRAWSRYKVLRYHHLVRGAKRRPSRLDGDPDQRHFITDRSRWTLDEIAAAVRREYGPRRAASRSAIHRFLQAMRQQLAQQPGQLSG